MTEVPRPSWVDDPGFDDELRRDLYYAIHVVGNEFLEVPLDQKRSPVYEKWGRQLGDDAPDEFIVNSKVAINDGYCKVFAERVHELLGHPSAVDVQSQGFTHSWLKYETRYYDVQVPEGVSHPSQLPVFG